MIAIDGKSAGGARGPDGRVVHLLAAFDQASGGGIWARAWWTARPMRSTRSHHCWTASTSPAIITADALHTQHRHADYLIGRGAHYVLTVKRNQPNLHRQLRALPWAHAPVVDVTRDKAHGRVESRTLKLAAVTAGIGFPHARLAIQLTRRRRSLTSHKGHTEIVYAITDLTWSQIRADQIAGRSVGTGAWRCDVMSHWLSEITEKGRVE